jgi:hypothetical protein
MKPLPQCIALELAFACIRLHASIGYAAESITDTVNDTGVECHGIRDRN